MNMLRFRVTTEAQPRTKNGQPAHSTTGVASASCSQFESCWPRSSGKVGEVPAHLQRDDRNGEDDADPEAPGHVDELGVGAGLRGDGHRFERHPADRARARPDLPDLRMHRAGVDRPSGTGAGRLVLRQELRRVGDEAFAAARRAEVVGAAGVVGPVLGGVRIDVHPADRVLGKVGRASL